MPNTRQYEYTPEKLEVSPSFYTTMKEREKLKISAEAVLTMYANSTDKKLDRLLRIRTMMAKTLRIVSCCIGKAVF